MPTLDNKSRPLVAITGMGVVTSLGQGMTDNWQALVAGRSGVRKIHRFDTSGMRTHIAGTVDFLDVEPYSAMELSTKMAKLSAREAIDEANIGTKSQFPGPLFIATPPSELELPHFHRLYQGDNDHELHGYKKMLAAARRGGFEDMYPLLQFTSIADVIADEFGTCGQPISLCTACASGSSAIQMGAEAIRRGETSASLCIATDATVHPEGIIRFSLLSALSTRNEPPEAASRPFAADRDGFVIAEGAGAMVLENYDAALARGADVLAIVMGAGERADEFHRTRSRPDGTAMIGAIEGALKDANVSPEEIDYINAHGTATPENDKMECLSLTAVFGKNVVKTPISSNKSMTGHTLIAAGAVEAVFSVMTIQSGIIPPTINYNKPDPTIALDVVPNISRNKPVSKVLSNSFGFGGQNCCLVFGLQ